MKSIRIPWTVNLVLKVSTSVDSIINVESLFHSSITLYEKVNLHRFKWQKCLYNLYPLPLVMILWN